jgi:pimeloyl-ACP methyl ester carboxylesterase
MRELYLLSGLGADRRVFDFIKLPGFNLNHVAWVEPFAHESLGDYAKRLLMQIPTKRPILIGMSFGGMIAIEIGKLIETERIILISSAKTVSDIPLSFRTIGRLGFYKLIPPKYLKSVNPGTHWMFGAKTKEEKELLTKILKDTDEIFLEWAITRIATWRNVTVLKNVIHIHGTNDRILPLTSADYIIPNGGHFMIVNKADELSRIILKILC